MTGVLGHMRLGSMGCPTHQAYCRGLDLWLGIIVDWQKSESVVMMVQSRWEMWTGSIGSMNLGFDAQSSP